MQTKQYHECVIDTPLTDRILSKVIMGLGKPNDVPVWYYFSCLHGRSELKQ